MPSNSIMALAACSGKRKETVAKPLGRRVCLQMGRFTSDTSPGHVQNNQMCYQNHQSIIKTLFPFFKNGNDTMGKRKA